MRTNVTAVSVSVASDKQRQNLSTAVQEPPAQLRGRKHTSYRSAYCCQHYKLSARSFCLFNVYSAAAPSAKVCVAQFLSDRRPCSETYLAVTPSFRIQPSLRPRT